MVIFNVPKIENHASNITSATLLDYK